MKSKVKMIKEIKNPIEELIEEEQIEEPKKLEKLKQHAINQIQNYQMI